MVLLDNNPYIQYREFVSDIESQMKDPWHVKDGGLCEYNSGKHRWKNVRDNYYSPVTIKPHGTMSVGFADQNNV